MPTRAVLLGEKSPGPLCLWFLVASAFLPKGCAWDVCCTGMAGWPRSRPWPMLTLGLIFLYLLIPHASCPQDPSSEERFHVELHFSPGVKGCEEDRNVPTGFGFRPASAEVSTLPRRRLPCLPAMLRAQARQQPCCSAGLCCPPASSSKFFSDLPLVLAGCWQVMFPA